MLQQKVPAFLELVSQRVAGAYRRPGKKQPTKQGQAEMGANQSPSGRRFRSRRASGPGMSQPWR